MFGLVATALTPILKLLRVSEVHRALKLTRSQVQALGDGPDHQGAITPTFPKSSSREWMLHPVPQLCKSWGGVSFCSSKPLGEPLGLASCYPGLAGSDSLPVGAAASPRVHSSLPGPPWSGNKVTGCTLT